ncbi:MULTISPECIES: ribosome silencing factor [Planktothricoides]|uniref:Ribosomal silencing factor RsfS n=2 Tax=Planktothricoides raciborskii TaxID=132608 RepID=A0AAU8JDT4_9CYAN|nr:MULTISPECIES: ribosome silencing factor [Planktothricoides]MBD2545185.1 ribosome silencing factor [Planktothricoides raciborskii FACHB-1370]MBD2583286.1 ribosome silencing factor [Planktothricoides raciborskii FACHB-1261]
MTEYPQTQVSPIHSEQNKGWRGGRQEQSRLLAETIARAADDRKGGDIVLLHVADVSYLAEYFVIVTGFSRVQVRAIADAIKHSAAEECVREPLRQEGQDSGNWLVQDYGDVIVHIFMPKEREYYNLEAFWSHAERVPFATGAIAP